ncbi:MAG: hypothetical protein KAT76_03295 [Bacteroidales bacterium]|nr:hypothetical protein [Bacteroidales bacterium]
MKKLIFALILIFSFGMMTVNAQVVISEDPAAVPDGSSILHLKSTDKGLLIPRLNITDIESQLLPVENPVEGLLIYNIGTTDGIAKGLYYWSEADAKWSLVVGGSSNIIQNFSDEFFYAAELWEDNEFSSPSEIDMPSSGSYYAWTRALEGLSFGDPPPEFVLGDPLTGAPAEIIVREGGLYKISFCISFAGTNNSQLEGAIYREPEGTPGPPTITRVRFLRKLASFGDIGSGSAQGLVELQADDVISVWFRSTSNSESLLVYNVNLILNKIGE